MDTLDVADLMQSLGRNARNASRAMARASAADKARALRELARLLRERGEPLAAANRVDLERAQAAGDLSAPMLDRLKLTPAILATCAQGCEQLAA
ncbi:MAG: gamma-glutamyl-phosphate reductase, partial [Burkholderiaceae bacterium]|nr:gamma-glutamyl-phosphate reductase [Burkholderiaceae bacterium]